MLQASRTNSSLVLFQFPVWSIKPYLWWRPLATDKDQSSGRCLLHCHLLTHPRYQRKKVVRLRSNGAICLPRRLSGDVEWLFALTLRDLEQSSPSGPAVGSFNGACSRTARYIKLPTRYTKHRRVLACIRSSASQILGLKFTGKDFRLWNNQGWIEWHFKKKTIFFFFKMEKNKLDEQNSSAYMRSEAAQ